jgi:hypothetical protein
MVENSVRGGTNYKCIEGNFVRIGKNHLPEKHGNSRALICGQTLIAIENDGIII